MLKTVDICCGVIHWTIRRKILTAVLICRLLKDLKEAFRISI